MRPQLYILFLMAFSSFFVFTPGQAMQDQPQVAFDFDTHDEWKEFGLFLSPFSIADEISKTPLVSSILGILSKANARSVQPGAQASLDSPHGRPEFRRSLEASLSEETTRPFEITVSSTVALRKAFYDALEFASLDTLPSNDALFTPLLKKLATFIAIARDDLRARFPLPATALGHAERERHASEALEHLQQLLTRLAQGHGVEREVVGRHLARAKPFLRDVGVLIGDVAELYPAAIEELALHISAVLFPESAFLRSLVILYFFGPYVLGKDAISEWLPKHVSEALRG